MMVAIHSFSHEDEEFTRGKTRVHDAHPAVAAHPGCFAPAPDISSREQRSSERSASRRDDLEEELSYRRETIAASKVRRREEKRAREREERQKAREDEARFWRETAELLAGDGDMRSALDEIDATDRREEAEQDWAAYRSAQLDPSEQAFWDESISIGDRFELDPDGSVARAVSEENARIRRSREIANGEAELWEDGGE